MTSSANQERGNRSIASLQGNVEGARVMPTPIFGILKETRASGLEDADATLSATWKGGSQSRLTWFPDESGQARGNTSVVVGGRFRKALFAEKSPHCSEGGGENCYPKTEKDDAS